MLRFNSPVRQGRLSKRGNAVLCIQTRAFLHAERAV
nr:MAG TPA: hypothetical protein [Caudoviricetes sp.]